MTRLLRIAGAVALVGLLCSFTRPAGAAAPAAGRISVLGQSSTVASGGTFDLHLSVTGGPPGAILQLAFYPALITRSTFDSDASGAVVGNPIQDDTVPLAAATPDPSGGIDVRVPVNAASKGHELRELVASSGSGVYPVELQLYSAGVPVGAPTVTFLVYDGGTAGFGRLDVALVVPVGADPVAAADGLAAPPPAPVLAGLDAVTSALAVSNDVPVSLDLTPQTVAGLANGKGLARSVFARITGLVANGDQVLPATYVGAPLDGLVDSGLADVVDAEVAAGDATLAARLGVSPDPSTWAAPGGIASAGVSALQDVGLDQLIVPSTDLSPLPAADQTITFAHPSALSAGNGAPLEVVGADPVLSSRIGQSGDPVLAAEQDLAELAMIHFEAPGSPTTRGVAVMVPAGVSPAWLRTFVAGLAGNPFVQPVTVRGLFADVGVLPAADSPTRLLVSQAAPAAGAGQIAQLVARRDEFARLVPGDAAGLDAVGRQLLLAASNRITPGTRDALVGAADKTIDAVEDQITVPRGASVTLTSRSANLPLTIGSDPDLVVHLRLVLTSSKLVFKPLHPPDGSCRVEKSQITEVCNLRVQARALTLRVPVASRTSGEFPLDVSVYAPGGGRAIQSESDTIRSTAVSFVGLALMIGALLFLGGWWIHNIRHGRRARQLVVPPGDDPDDGDGGGGPDDTAPAPPQPGPGSRAVPDPPGSWLEDPVVAEFFASPPPAWGDREPEMSPSERRSGPSS